MGLEELSAQLHKAIADARAERELDATQDEIRILKRMLAVMRDPKHSIDLLKQLKASEHDHAQHRTKQSAQKTGTD